MKRNSFGATYNIVRQLKLADTYISKEIVTLKTYFQKLYNLICFRPLFITEARHALVKYVHSVPIRHCTNNNESLSLQKLIAESDELREQLQMAQRHIEDGEPPLIQYSIVIIIIMCKTSHLQFCITTCS